MNLEKAAGAWGGWSWAATRSQRPQIKTKMGLGELGRNGERQEALTSSFADVPITVRTVTKLFQRFIFPLPFQLFLPKLRPVKMAWFCLLFIFILLFALPDFACFYFQLPPLLQPTFIVHHHRAMLQLRSQTGWMWGPALTLGNLKETCLSVSKSPCLSAVTT